jgi:hypothetical protein
VSDISSLQLFPEVIDGSTLGASYSQPLYLPIGIEGQGLPTSTATVGQVKRILRASEANAYFGAGSSLANLIAFILDRGVTPLYATMSQRVAAPTIAERNTAWDLLESNKDVRIRLTDSTVQAEIAALAQSCVDAEKIQNKQFCFVGMPSGTTKANQIAAATAIGSKRGVLVAPSVYDNAGTLLSGAYAAAAVACEVAKNADPTDDLDMMVIPNLSGIERDAAGMDVFRSKVISGTAVNDFEDLLQGGVSPLMPGRPGGVAISHLRMTYKVDSTFDALMTRILVDQVFTLVREYCYDFHALRRGNTPVNRDLLRSGIEALLIEHGSWVLPLVQSDGTVSYNVSVVASTDQRQMIVKYQGQIVRGVQTIFVDGQLFVTI